MSSPKLSLKVVMNKEKTKVLFAEANADFVNVLLSFLLLPLGKVVSILRKHSGEEQAPAVATGSLSSTVGGVLSLLAHHSRKAVSVLGKRLYGDEQAPALGSLYSLYVDMLTLDDAYLCSRGAKQMLMNPPTPLAIRCRNLAIDVTESAPNRYFLCEDQKCPSASGYRNISLYSDIASCSHCGRSLNREIRVPEFRRGGVFTIDPLSFIVTDDLSLSPMTGIAQTLISNHDTQGVEMKIVKFGIDEVRDLLKASLTSATPLTDIVLKKTGSSSGSTTAAKPEPWILSRNIHESYLQSGKTIVLRACLQKSTNKFLFAVANDEFVDLLYRFLTVPLGGVEFLLGGNVGLKSIDRLYKSVAEGLDPSYFRTEVLKNRLICPKLAHGYTTRNQFLPLCGEGPPELYYEEKCYWRNGCAFHEYRKDGSIRVPSFKLNEELYVKKQTTFMVTDDLTVSPSLATSLSIINDLGIACSDVKEVELRIGPEEALRVLKASLTSKTALTDALIKPLLNKSPKQERL